MVSPLPDVEPSHQPSLDADLALVTDVAREAGQLALSWLKHGARVWEKSPNNPVTEADIAVNDLIRKRLSAERPDYGWLSEETKDNPANRTQARTFVVDPIDGTKAFVKGEPGFCVSIARLEGNQPVVGVIYNPMTEELLAARLGGGAKLNGRPIHVTTKTGLACRMVGQPDVFKGRARDLWPDVELISPMPNALAYRIALVAMGKWDAAVALNNKNDWDLAAAVLILSEAGGVATDRHGERFVFNRQSVIQAGVIAAGPRLHALVMEKVSELIRRYMSQSGARPMPTAAPSKTKAASGSAKQLLHLVIGGELKDVTGVEFRDLSKVDFVGAYPSYKAAYDAWKGAAQRTVDNAHMRYFILHAHRLLDPETGHTHDV
jgi:myo-inositol-1(or 4)-monophosphatase